MDRLPNETKDLVLGYLKSDVEAIKNIRLVARSWAFLAAPYLLSPVFTALPHRDDFTRLIEVSQHPYFSQRIKTLSIRWMSVDEDELRLILIAPHGGYDYDEEKFRKSWGQYRTMKGLIDLYSDSFCNEELLIQAFKSLPELTAVHANPNSYLFSTNPINTYLYDAITEFYNDPNLKRPADYHIRHNILSAIRAACPPTSQIYQAWQPNSISEWGGCGIKDI